MSWRPEILVYVLIALALVGVPADRADPGGLSGAGAEGALISLKISTLGRDLGRLEERFVSDCAGEPGVSLPVLCSAYADALEDIARRGEELGWGRPLVPRNQSHFGRSVEQPLMVARLKLEEIETHVLRVRELLEVQHSMREGLRLGDAAAAMAAYNTQCMVGTPDFAPEMLLDLIFGLEELAFQAENLKEPGLRDRRTY